MSTEWIIALLAIALMIAAAAFLIVCAKRDEEKEQIAAERKRWREALDARIRREEFWVGVAERLTEERNELQDRLSEVLCPRNNHIWEPTTLFDGASRCKRCGRIKE